MSVTLGSLGTLAKSLRKTHHKYTNHCGSKSLHASRQVRIHGKSGCKVAQLEQRTELSHETEKQDIWGKKETILYKQKNVNNIT